MTTSRFTWLSELAPPGGRADSRDQESDVALDAGDGLAKADGRPSRRSWPRGGASCVPGEKRVLRPIASIADGNSANLREALNGIDRHNFDLLISAKGSAAGQRRAHCQGNRPDRTEMSDRRGKSEMPPEQAVLQLRGPGSEA